jgi:hypothetical protein
MLKNVIAIVLVATFASVSLGSVGLLAYRLQPGSFSSTRAMSATLPRRDAVEHGVAATSLTLTDGTLPAYAVAN